MSIAITLAACVDSSLNQSNEPPPSPSTSSTSPTIPPTTTSATTTSAPTTTTSTTSTTAPTPISGVGCWSSPIDPSTGPVTLEDATASLGLVEPLLGMHGHAAAWGDVNGDGWPDLFVGTFADRPAAAYRTRGAAGPSPDRLLLGGPDGFVMDRSFPELPGRAAGAVFADLDSDGELELVVAHNQRAGTPGTSILDLEGDGWRRVPLPVVMGARAVGVLDADGDGLLDLFITEDRWSGGSSRLLRNRGALDFVDVTEEAGLPLDVHGLGVSTVDLDGDGRPDIFVSGSNRLFVNRGGTFREVRSDVFDWELFGDEDDVAGVAVADLNRDGLPDLVLGQHFNSTIDQDRRVPVRLYLNQGGRGGDLAFIDITERAGLVGLPTKAPHVEIVDVDNDGWPDIVTSASADNGTRPAIFMHRGVEGGIPRFEAPAGLGSDQYWVTGGAADTDRDGRQDFFLVEWEPALPSLIFRNETRGGHWLSIAVGEPHRGIGTLVEVYEDGRAGEKAALLGSREIGANTGYAAGIQPVVHFGLGNRNSVDVVVTVPSGESRVLAGTRSDQHIDLGSCS